MLYNDNYLNNIDLNDIDLETFDYTSVELKDLKKFLNEVIIEFTINGNIFMTRYDITVIESCKFTGINIPRFCYHESLSVAGNCRMCLIQLEDDDKFYLACSTIVEFGSEIITNSLNIKKARENILEFLLLNHPLDCPICDQGGECDLQNLSKEYANYVSKIFVNRRSVKDKNFSFFIKTIMTRCIHCTRCVRFSSEILETEFLGTLGRGYNTEIGNYVNSFVNESNMSGNLIDLCPVGALTAKVHAYKIRPWELQIMETIDLTDNFGSNIFVHVKETNIVRILPKPNIINGNLISNKARFSFDSLTNNRLYKINLKSQKYWTFFLEKLKKNEDDYSLLIILNEQIDLKTANLLKCLSFLKKEIKIRLFSNYRNYSNLYFFVNDSISYFDKNYNNYSIIIGSTSDTENEILNTKIKVKSSNQNHSIFFTNFKYDSKIYNNIINLSIIDTFFIFEGKFKNLSKIFFHKKIPQVIINNSFLKRFSKFFYLTSLLNNLNNNIKIININSLNNSEIKNFLGIKSLNLNDITNNNVFFFFNINKNIMFMKNCLQLKKKIIYWFNSHFSNILKSKNNFIIPIQSNYFESSGIYINVEQRFQKAAKIIDKESNINFFDNFIKLFLYQKDFKYFDFIKEIFKKHNNTFFENKFSRSLLKNFFFVKYNYIISLYPIKLQLQKNIKLDNFLQNSYNINLFFFKKSKVYEKSNMGSVI